MDFIFIDDLRLTTRIGVYDWERYVAQPVAVSLEIELPSAKPCTSDDFADALDYAAVVKRLQALATDHSHHLLERFAEAIARIVLEEFRAPRVRVRVAKLAPISGVRQLGVTIERSREDG